MNAKWLFKVRKHGAYRRVFRFDGKVWHNHQPLMRRCVDVWTSKLLCLTKEKLQSRTRRIDEVTSSFTDSESVWLTIEFLSRNGIVIIDVSIQDYLWLCKQNSNSNRRARWRHPIMFWWLMEIFGCQRRSCWYFHNSNLRLIDDLFVVDIDNENAIISICNSKTFRNNAEMWVWVDVPSYWLELVKSYWDFMENIEQRKQVSFSSMNHVRIKRRRCQTNLLRSTVRGHLLSKFIFRAVMNEHRNAFWLEPFA